VLMSIRRRSSLSSPALPKTSDSSTTYVGVDEVLEEWARRGEVLEEWARATRR
jgi:hypothetical protein